MNADGIKNNPAAMEAGISAIPLQKKLLRKNMYEKDCFSVAHTLMSAADLLRRETAGAFIRNRGAGRSR
jgi:hypothetical protein